MECFALWRLHGDAEAAAHAQVDLDLRRRKPLGAPPLGQLCGLGEQTEDLLGRGTNTRTCSRTRLPCWPVTVSASHQRSAAFQRRAPKHLRSWAIGLRNAPSGSRQDADRARGPDRGYRGRKFGRCSPGAARGGSTRSPSRRR
jgi:hypothetical protein